jgi:hypothetical protein
MIKSDFIKAKKIIGKLTPKDQHMVKKICLEIQDAQNHLLHAAEKAMEKCTTSCHGLCCKNVRLDEIINFWDFVYILSTDRFLENKIVKCLEKETLFSSDCIFLKDGMGPCIFQGNTKPKICIMSFCTDVSDINKEIRLVGRKFNKLVLFYMLRRPMEMKDLVMKWFSRN